MMGDECSMLDSCCSMNWKVRSSDFGAVTYLCCLHDVSQLVLCELQTSPKLNHTTNQVTDFTASFGATQPHYKARPCQVLLNLPHDRRCSVHRNAYGHGQTKTGGVPTPSNHQWKNTTAPQYGTRICQQRPHFSFQPDNLPQGCPELWAAKS